MVFGHAKFGPDLVSRSIAGRYNREEIFIHATVNHHISALDTSIAYDNEVLQNWRKATPKLVSPIEGITQYKPIIILVDDRKILFDEIDCPDEIEEYQGCGRYFNVAMLFRRLHILKRVHLSSI